MRFRYIDNTDDEVYIKRAKKEIIDRIDNSEDKSYVYLEFHYHFGLDESKVVIELFDDVCPKTCQNFRELCKGYKREDGKEIGYKNTRVERIVKNQFITFGDIQRNVSEGPYSIYGG